MPLHDWTKPHAGTYHHFHQQWTGKLCDALNGGILPKGFYALVEQYADKFKPDVLAMHSPLGPQSETLIGGIATATAPPKSRYVYRAKSETAAYAQSANRIAVREELGELVAIIEIISPGNKDSRVAVKDFVGKVVKHISAGVHVLLVDIFPPSKRAPQGFHSLIWEEISHDVIEGETFGPMAVSYLAETETVAYLEPLVVGQSIPEMPLFLSATHYIQTPLEASYQETWEKLPEPVRGLVS